MANDLVVVARATASPRTFDECIGIAKALEKGDAAAVIALFDSAARIKLSRLETEMLIQTIAKAAGVPLKPLRETWAKAQAEDIARRGKRTQGIESVDRLNVKLHFSVSKKRNAIGYGTHAAGSLRAGRCSKTWRLWFMRLAWWAKPQQRVRFI